MLFMNDGGEKEEGKAKRTFRKLDFEGSNV